MSRTRLYLGQIPAAGGGPTAYTLTALPGALHLSGQVAATPSGRKLAANPAALALSGGVATFRLGHSLPALPGALVLTGQVSTTSVGRKLTALPGVLTLTGRTATFSVGRKLAALPGSLTLSISSAATPVGRRLVASLGSLSFTGIVAGLTYSTPSGTAYALGGNPAALVLTGAAANLTKSVRVTGTAANLTLAGLSATLRSMRPLAAAPGVLTFTGQTATFVKAMRFTATLGQLNFSSLSATMRVGRTMPAEPAALTLTGSVANLVYVPFTGVRNYVLEASPGQLVLSCAPATLTGPAPLAVSWGGMGGSGGGKIDLEELTFLKEIEGKVKAGMTIEEALKVAPAIRVVPTTIQAVVKKAEKVGSNLSEIHARIAHLEAAVALEKAARDDEDESELLLMIAEIL